MTNLPDAELDEKFPDWQNIPQMLQALADDIQHGDTPAVEVAVAIRDKMGAVTVYGGGPPTMNYSTTYFLFHQGAKTLMEIVEEGRGDGDPIQ